MKINKNLMFSVLSVALTVLAVIFGADSSFAMAVDSSVNLAEDKHKQDPAMGNHLGSIDKRPEHEHLQKDEQGGKTQLQGKAATGTDVRDAGLEAEDYDDKIVHFRKMRFPMETYIAEKCTPVKCNSYVRGHYRVGSTDLNATYKGAEVTIDKSYINKLLSVAKTDLENHECLSEYSTVFILGAKGYRIDPTDPNKDIEDGALALFVVSNQEEGDSVKFRILNPPTKNGNTKITPNLQLVTAATACSESQMRVAPESYLPEKEEVYLQKKIATCVITDEFKEQSKKASFVKNDILANTLYNFKRKCARSHWIGKGGRIDVSVKELGGQREADYFEEGILRQIPMLYLHGQELTFEDMMALSALQFTNNSVSDEATVFCGKKAIQRYQRLALKSTAYRDIAKVEVNEMGIKVRYWKDNFGTFEFVYDPTLDDIGYEDYMVVVDLKNAVRYYKRNEQQNTLDMKKTSESREAEVTMISRIDCVCLKGYNAILVCPTSSQTGANVLGGVLDTIKPLESSVTAEGNLPTDEDTVYIVTAEAGVTMNDGTVYPKGTGLKKSDGKWIEYTGPVKNQ